MLVLIITLLLNAGLISSSSDLYNKSAQEQVELSEFVIVDIDAV